MCCDRTRKQGLLLVCSIISYNFLLRFDRVAFNGVGCLHDLDCCIFASSKYSTLGCTMQLPSKHQCSLHISNHTTFSDRIGYMLQSNAHSFNVHLVVLKSMNIDHQYRTTYNKSCMNHMHYGFTIHRLNFISNSN